MAIEIHLMKVLDQFLNLFYLMLFLPVEFPLIQIQYHYFVVIYVMIVLLHFVFVLVQAIEGLSGNVQISIEPIKGNKPTQAIPQFQALKTKENFLKYD